MLISLHVVDIVCPVYINRNPILQCKLCGCDIIHQHFSASYPKIAGQASVVRTMAHCIWNGHILCTIAVCCDGITVYHTVQ